MSAFDCYTSAFIFLTDAVQNWTRLESIKNANRKHSGRVEIIINMIPWTPKKLKLTAHISYGGFVPVQLKSATPSDIPSNSQHYRNSYSIRLLKIWSKSCIRFSCYFLLFRTSRCRLNYGPWTGTSYFRHWFCVFDFHTERPYFFSYANQTQTKWKSVFHANANQSPSRRKFQKCYAV